MKYLSEVNDGDITESKYIRDKSIIEYLLLCCYIIYINRDFLRNFLPASVEFETDDISRVASLFESLNFNIFDTKRGFIEYAEKSPYFGFTVFPVRVFYNIIYNISTVFYLLIAIKSIRFTSRLLSSIISIKCYNM